MYLKIGGKYVTYTTKTNDSEGNAKNTQSRDKVNVKDAISLKQSEAKLGTSTISPFAFENVNVVGGSTISPFGNRNALAQKELRSTAPDKGDKLRNPLHATEKMTEKERTLF